MDPRVSIVITAHNYGRFLRQCLDSSLGQQFAGPFEVVLVNDGSSDTTGEICREYERRHPDRLRILHLDGVGLSKALNAGIALSRGGYVVRLDADDYFDERLLMLEVDFLDRHPEIGMVYPDHFRITSEGVLIDYVKLPRVGDEVTLLDGNPIPSGSMYRRECYDAVGGYNEALRHQEDFDFWIKFIERYQVHNLPLPLVYYRKHQVSMSTNLDGRMAARRFVKRRFVEDHRDLLSNSVVAIIPAMGAARVGEEKLPLRQLGGRPVLAYSIEEARKVRHVSRVLVSTEDPEVAEAARSLGAEVPYLRPVELASSYVPKRTVVAHMLQHLKDQEGFSPDLAVILPVFTPLRRASHIREAVDTMCIYHFDSVIGVVEDLSMRWKPGAEGLQAIGPQKRVIKHDKETTYRENGALYVLKAGNLFTGTFLGDRVGYIEMFEHESVRLESEYDFFVAEALVTSKAWNAPAPWRD